jgi:prepilin-type N-terminal cleavage/methylation domain-containing protein
MKLRGFTLIELLVVIAIIAILAAILFPVFAQAKMAAKKTVELSNVKQMSLGIIMYENDYDDNYSTAFNPANNGGSWAGSPNPILWCQFVQPYTKNINIFYGPTDSLGGVINSNLGTWAGTGLSLAVNGWYDELDWNNGCPFHGLMGMTGQGGWLGTKGAPDQANESQVTQPAATVLLTEKHEQDIQAAQDPGSWIKYDGNLSNYWPLGFIGGGQVEQGGWGPHLIPDGNLLDPGFIQPWTGTRTPTAAYPFGPNGSVSTTAPSTAGQNNQTACFAFVDGHAKAMNPAATDPDMVGQPQNNMWDALR